MVEECSRLKFPPPPPLPPPKKKEWKLRKREKIYRERNGSAENFQPRNITKKCLLSTLERKTHQLISQFTTNKAKIPKRERYAKNLQVRGRGRGVGWEESGRWGRRSNFSNFFLPSLILNHQAFKSSQLFASKKKTKYGKKPVISAHHWIIRPVDREKRSFNNIIIGLKICK